MLVVLKKEIGDNETATLRVIYPPFPSWGDFFGDAMKECALFTITLLHSATNAHLMHLKSRSFSEHMALGTYYDEIVDLVDAYVEAYQGIYGLVEDYPNVYHAPKEPLKYLESLQKFVSAARQDLPQDPQLNNLVDAIADLIDSTTYKLKFLK